MNENKSKTELRTHRLRKSVLATLLFILLPVMLAAIATAIFANSALALGIGPSREYINFDEGLEKDKELFIINDKKETFKAVVYAQGDFAEHIRIKKPLIDVAATDEMKKVEYRIKFPKGKATPGEHKIEIVVKQLPPDDAADDGTVISADVAVISQLIVKVPYSGKYAEGKLFISGSENPDSAARFLVMLYNFGTEPIANAYAKVEIFGPTWEKLTEFKTNTAALQSKEEAKLEALWKPNLNKGTYVAVVTVYYDDKQFKLEQNFDVGTFMIDVSDISVKKFKLGDVAKFDITLFNSWNQNIGDVYVEMSVLDSNGKTLTQFKTASIEVAPQREGLLEAYWYTEGVMPGIYNVNMLIHYAGKIVQKEYEFEVDTNSIKQIGLVGYSVTNDEEGKSGTEKTLIILVLFVVIVLIAMNVAWFYYMSKHVKKEG